jgi:UDP-N-acetylmuramate--alanine ligase
MRALPLSIGTIHFVGIGGIGMSGIAEILHNLGYDVQGSDLAESANVQRLRALGVPIAIGHDAGHVAHAEVVVVSSAVKGDNPEVATARARLVPVVRRAEMLAELMRLKWSVAVGGTHGKTTTTSLIAAVLEAAGLDPTVINGGIINAYGTNARLGAGDWMVVEADESDGSFVKLPATIAVVTNIDPEHLDFYGSVEALHGAFESFVANIPFYGYATLCLDHPVVQSMIPRLSDHKVVTYGLSPQADVRAVNFRMSSVGTTFDALIVDRLEDTVRVLEALRLPMLGEHNVQNALAAIAVGAEMRIDDYGHHPVEIAAVLKAARTAGRGRVIAVVQPHRYSRLSSLFEGFCTCFNDADLVIVADVYAAGEPPIAGIDRDALVAGLRHHGHRAVLPLDHPDRLATLVHEHAEPGDLVVCLGAGTVTNWAQALPGALRQQQARAAKKAGGAS